MCESLWFFTDKDNRINLGSKPSHLASFVVLTRTESAVPFQEIVTQLDLSHMGYNQPQDLIDDSNYHAKIRIYVRKKYAGNPTDDHFIENNIAI